MTEVNWKFGEPASEANISALEKRLGCSLPTDYRDLLAKKAGGRAVPSCFALPGGQSVVVDRLLPLLSPAGDDVESVANAMESRTPFRLVPIALDPFGNVFALRYDRGEVRDVVFWNHENGTVEHAAQSFSDLIDGLHEEG